jgi:hypothetical protein
MKHHQYQKPTNVLAAFRVSWGRRAGVVMRWWGLSVLLLGLSLSCSDNKDANTCDSCPSGLTCDASGLCSDPAHGAYALSCRSSLFSTGQLVSETQQTFEGEIGPSATGTYELLVRDLMITLTEVLAPAVTDRRMFALSSTPSRPSINGSATLSDNGELSFQARIRLTLCCWEDLSCTGVKRAS